MGSTGPCSSDAVAGHVFREKPQLEYPCSREKNSNFIMPGPKEEYTKPVGLVLRSLIGYQNS